MNVKWIFWWNSMENKTALALDAEFLFEQNIILKPSPKKKVLNVCRYNVRLILNE